MKSCFGIFWEKAGKISQMGNYFPRLWTKWENYNENFWENTGLFRKTMKSCFGIFWEIAGKNPTWEKIFSACGQNGKIIMGIFGKIWDYSGKR